MMTEPGENKASQKDFLVDDSDYRLSLSKLAGKKIADIVGYASSPFGGAIFLISYIVFDDGTKINVGGEHDTPYLEEDGNLPNLNEDTLQRFAEENNE